MLHGALVMEQSGTLPPFISKTSWLQILARGGGGGGSVVEERQGLITPSWPRPIRCQTVAEDACFPLPTEREKEEGGGREGAKPN